MQEQTTQTLWDNVEAYDNRAFFKFETGKTIDVVFEDDGAPPKTPNPKFKPQLIFNVVIDGKKYLWGISQQGILGPLKSHRPLINKRFSISKTGDGIETRYHVEAIDEEIESNEVKLTNKMY